MVSFSEPCVNQTLFLRSMLCVNQTLFLISGRFAFLNRQITVWISWVFSICEIYWKDRTAGHLVFWKPWPVTGHIGHIGTAKQICVIWYSSRQKQITLSVYWFPRPNSFKTRKPISVSRNTANILECRQIEAVIKTFFAFHEL